MGKRTELTLGETIAGKFAIEARLGGGAMGAVYKAKQVSLDKKVALKVLHRELSDDEKFAARFLREAKTASRIDHPNSMRVLDFGEEPDGLLYMAMEYLDGRDLFHLIKEEWPVTTPRMVELLSQILAALAVAHDLGVIHRDLKPENIMVLNGTDDEGRTKDIVKVCDFGIAKMMDERDEEDSKEGPLITTRGLVVGTPEYMSPEQGRGQKLDARSDLYSVGVILFKMLTKRVPFEADTPLGVVLKHVTEMAPKPSEFYRGVDPALEAICMKAMRKKPHERFQNAREMRTELRSIVGPVSVAMPAASFPKPSASAPPPPTIRVGDTVPDADERTGSATTEVAFDSDAVRAREPRAPVVRGAASLVGGEEEERASSNRYAGFVFLGVVVVALAITLYIQYGRGVAAPHDNGPTIAGPGTTPSAPASTPAPPSADPVQSAALEVPESMPSASPPPSTSAALLPVPSAAPSVSVVRRPNPPPTAPRPPPERQPEVHHPPTPTPGITIEPHGPNLLPLPNFPVPPAEPTGKTE